MIAQFTTRRLRVRYISRLPEGQIARQRVETELAHILTPPVLCHLPAALHFDQGAGQIGLWLTARMAESQVLVLSDRASRRTVGLLLLGEAGPAGDMPSLHLGYLLAQDRWGEGLATELLAGLLHALLPHGPLRLFGGVGQANPASARVLTKAGFARDPGLSGTDTDVFVFDLPAPRAADQPISGEPLP